MAVARKDEELKPIEGRITLEDGQDVFVVLRRAKFTPGHQEAAQEALISSDVVQRRIEHFATKAAEAETDEEYERYKARHAEFVKKAQGILDIFDSTIRLLVAEWDLALTVEDEKNRKYVPLDLAGIRSLPERMRFDLFTKITEKVKKYTEAEKKALSVTSASDTPTPKERKEASLFSTQGSKSPSDFQNDPLKLQDGILTNLTKPS